MNCDTDRMRFLVEKFAGQKILVLGDLMLDRYIHGTVNRISPEAPVPVVRVRGEKNAPGGAANVARNVRSLGGRVVLSGVIGQDQAGRDLLGVLEAEGVSTDGITTFPNVRTTVKTRILAERQQVVRVDWDERLELSDDEWKDFRNKAMENIQDASGLVIEDYAMGAVRQDVVKSVIAEAKLAGLPVALDPKDNFSLDVQGITVATPNRKEAFILAGMTDRGPCENPLEDTHLIKAADILIRMWESRFLVVTLGAQGMLLMSDDGSCRHIATVAREVFDVSGAGDTVVAAVILGLASGADPAETALLANRAAGVVVGKLGTAGCTREEMLKFNLS